MPATIGLKKIGSLHFFAKNRKVYLHMQWCPLLEMPAKSKEKFADELRNQETWEIWMKMI